jgi:DNA repair and recombination protein RAD52
MTNWADISTDLAKPLQASAVKGRKQGGSTVNYIEGWHAINEANRIFGFDGWTRETVAMICVSEKPRKIGKDNPKDGYGVSYTARVRVVVHGIVREGFGAGHGIDVDCGQAHESATKEAETDAMKRALMTFGYQFGLALYDKDRTNVTNEPDVDHAAILADLLNIVGLCQTAKELSDLKATERFSSEMNALPEDKYKQLAAAYQTKKAALMPKAA